MMRSVAIFIVFCNFFLIADNAVAASADDARQFVDSVGKHVLDVVNGKGNESQRQAQLRQMFIDNVDIAWMAKFVLGRGWQQISEEQRNHYMEAYKRYLLEHYTKNFSDYTGSKYTITGVSTDEDGQFTVNMQIKASNQGQDTMAGYRVRAEENGGFKIVDIIVEGVSLITTERSEFSSVFQQKGIDGLMSAIAAKTQAEDSSAK